jgi:hypothetical protein
MILLRKERKEAWYGKRGPAKSAETRVEVLGSKEGLKEKKLSSNHGE